MKYFNNLVARVFSYENENFEKIKEAMIKLFPFDFEKEKITFKVKKAIGFNEKEIRIIEVKLNKNKLIFDFFKNIIKNLSEDEFKKLLGRIEKNIGIEKNCFYLRLLKPELIKGKFIITDSGNCFHFKFSIAAFQKNKDKVAEILKKILNEV